MAGEGWYADGVDLSTYAWNVKNRAAGWNIPGTRGDNAIVAGRDGEVYRRKPRDVGGGVLSMWAVGALPSGALSTTLTQRQMARYNLDRLSQVFGRDRLIELVRCDDKDAYGTANLCVNPSAESSTGLTATRMNLFVNPSGEYSSGVIPYRYNVLRNPQMEQAFRNAVVRRNLVPNPRMSLGGSSVVGRTNLMPNPSFEATLKTWAATNNVATMTRVAVGTTQAQSGSYVLQVKATQPGGQNTFVDGGPCPVTAGQTYTASATIRNKTAGNRDYYIRVLFKNSAGTGVGNNYSNQTQVAAGATSRLSISVAAPAGATKVYVRLIQITPSNNDLAWWDAVMVEKAGSLGTYFDGTSHENDGWLHRWKGEAGLSASEEYRTPAMGWRGGSNVATRVTTAEAAKGLQSIKAVAAANIAIDGTLVEQTPTQASPMTGSTDVCGSIMLRTFDTILTQSVKVAICCYDSAGAYLGLAGSEATVTLDAGSWETFAVTGTTHASTVKIGWRVRAAEQIDTGEGLYVDCAQLDYGRLAGDYFDGDDPDGEVYSYGWSGQPHWSTSEMTAYWTSSWNAGNGSGVRITDAYRGQYALRVEAPASPTTAEKPYVYNDLIEAHPNQVYTAQAYVRHTRGINVRARIRWSDGTDSTGSSVLLTAATWTQVTVTGTAPATATGGTLYVETVDNPSAGDQFDIDSGMVEPAGGVRTYFDGYSGSGYGFLGWPGESASVAYKPRADGWSGYGSARPTVYREATGNEGSYHVEAYASMAGNLGVTSGNEQVDPGTSYALGVGVYLPGTGRTVTVGIEWRDTAGAVISVSSTGTAVNSQTWTRLTQTATAPANAAAASPFVSVASAAVNEVLWIDSAVFGFGSTTTYADGDSGSGWMWTGTKDYSRSEQLAAAVDGFYAYDATLVRATGALRGFPKEGAAYALLTVTGTTTPRAAIILEGDYDRARPVLWPGVPITVAADVSPSVNNAQVQIRLVPMNWTGFGWQYAPETVLEGTKTPVTNGSGGARISWTTSFPANYTSTHFQVEIRLYAAGGGAPTVGDTLAIDKVVIGWNLPNTDYFDGDTAYCRWLGAQDASQSMKIGPARRAWVEVVDGVDMESMAGGTRAEFNVEYKIPATYWEDTVLSSFAVPMGRDGGVITLFALRGMTAPIHDAIIRFTGSAANFTVTDMASGAWFKYAGRLNENQYIDLNNGDWTVVDAAGRSVVTACSHSGHARWLPITVDSDDLAPRFKVEGEIGRGSAISVIARRRFQIA